LNVHTHVGQSSWASERLWTFERLFKQHFAAIRELHAGAAGPGYLSVAICGNQQISKHALLGTLGRESADRTLIIGRHGRAPMRLANDPSIALRHLLVRLTGTTPLIRILDLHTGQGFRAEGAGACQAVASDGCLFVQLGIYALMFFPLAGSSARWSDDPDAVWKAISPRSIVDKRNVNLVSSVIGPPTARNDVARCPGSQVTVLPGLSGIERQITGEPLPAGTVGVLTLEQDNVAAFYPMTQAQLERGVLLGRYSRCSVATQLLRRDDTVSRVHLLLLKENDRVLAIDTASSNGTSVDGVPISAVELPEQATIELGTGNLLRWLRVQDSSLVNHLH
jgi:hypothetical protein